MGRESEYGHYYVHITHGETTIVYLMPTSKNSELENIPS